MKMEAFGGPSAHKEGLPRPSAWVESAVGAFLDAAADLATLPELEALYARAALEIGYEYFALARLAEPGVQTDECVVSTIAVRYPEPWQLRYATHGYGRVDPVLRHARSTAAPYAWSEIPNLSAPEREVLREAASAGLAIGLSIPIHEPCGRVFLASLAASHEPGARTPLAHLLALQFYARLRAFAVAGPEDPDVCLTPRERECLQWTARGKSSWDIGQIVGISQHTVNFHLKNAMRKFGTHSRVCAALQSARMGWITP